MVNSTIKDTPFFGTPLAEPPSNSVSKLQDLAAAQRASGAAQMSSATAQHSADPSTSACPSDADLIAAGEFASAPTLFDIKLGAMGGAARQFQTSGTPQASFNDPSSVRAAEQQVRGELGSAGDTALVKAAVKSFFLAAHPESASTINKALAQTKLSKDDVQEFTATISASRAQAAKSPNPTSAALAATNASAGSGSIGFKDVLFLYYSNYFNNGFVDRHGSKISSPQIEKSVTDAEITNMTQIFLEALADYVFRDPIIADAKYPGGSPKYFYGNKSSDVPTALSSYNNDDKSDTLLNAVATVPVGCEGFTFGEGKAVGYLGHLSGHLAVLNAGSLFDALSSIHVGFVLAGNFAVGSNNTLSSVVKTSMQVIVQRSVEHYLQDGMTHLSATDSTSLQQTISKLPGYAKPGG